MTNEAPLSGYRVLDLSHLLPGELATMWLADLGADVIKVEAPETHAGGLAMPRDRSNPYRAAFNRSKRSITLNLKHEDGQRVLRRLVETADVLVEGFRPGVMKRLGADYETLREVNPRLVYCSISGYGEDGPYRERPGHDNNYLALAGLLARNRGDDGRPHLLPVQLADVGGGAMPAVMAILSALLARERTEEGQHIDASMLDGALAWTYLLLPVSRFPGLDDMGVGAGMLTGDAPCYNVYETADGEYLALGALEPKFWLAFCDAAGRPDLAQRGFDSEALSDVRDLFRTRTLNEWIDVIDPDQVPLTPLHDFDEMLDDPHVQVRETIFRDEFDTPHARFPVRFGDTPAREPAPAPNLGEHTDAVLRDELNLTETEVAELREAGIL